MSAIGKLALVLAMTAMSGGQALAEADAVDTNVRAVKSAAWDRVGEGSGAVDQGAVHHRARARASGDGGGLQARKAEMVRRMFWIMLAHR